MPNSTSLASVRNSHNGLKYGNIASQNVGRIEGFKLDIVHGRLFCVEDTNFQVFGNFNKGQISVSPQ